MTTPPKAQKSQDEVVKGLTKLGAACTMTTRSSVLMQAPG
jgi:hypothetical protein